MTRPGEERWPGGPVVPGPLGVRGPDGVRGPLGTRGPDAVREVPVLPYSGTTRYFTTEQGPPIGEPMKLLDSDGNRIFWDGRLWKGHHADPGEAEPWPPKWAPAGYVFYEALPPRILPPEVQRRWKEKFPDA